MRFFGVSVPVVAASFVTVSSEIGFFVKAVPDGKMQAGGRQQGDTYAQNHSRASFHSLNAFGVFVEIIT